MSRYYMHNCPVCGVSVLPSCFKMREDATDEQFKAFLDILERKMAVHMVLEHPDDLDTPTA